MKKPMEYDKCIACGRALKKIESRIQGYGSTCLKKRQEVETVPGTKMNETFETEVEESAIVPGLKDNPTDDLPL